MSALIFAGGDPSKVDVSGYTKGDVLAANTTGVLRALPVGPDGDVLTADHVAAEGVDWQPGGGGGGASPGNTVVTEQAFGQASTPGAVVTYSRSDHTHGTPVSPRVRITLGAFNTSGNVTCAAGLPYTQVDADLVIAAATGDILGVAIQAVINDSGAELVLDMATRVGAADVNYLSSGTNTPRFNGALPPWLQTTIGSGNFPTLGDEVLYKVQAGDVSAGTVTLRPYGAGDGGTRVVIRSAAFPLRCWVKNYGPGT